MVQCPGCESVVLVPYQPLLHACTSQIQHWSQGAVEGLQVAHCHGIQIDGHLQSSKKDSSRDQSSGWLHPTAWVRLQSNPWAKAATPLKGPLVKPQSTKCGPEGSFRRSLPAPDTQNPLPPPPELSSCDISSCRRSSGAPWGAWGSLSTHSLGPLDTGTVLGLSQTHSPPALGLRSPTQTSPRCQREQEQSMKLQQSMIL